MTLKVSRCQSHQVLCRCCKQSAHGGTAGSGNRGMGAVCVPLHQHVGGVRGSVGVRALQVARASPQRPGSRFPAAGSSCSTSAPRHQQMWPGRSQELERAVTRRQPVKCPWDVAAGDSQEVTNSRVTERRGLEALPGMGAGAWRGSWCSSQRVSGCCCATHGGQAGSGGLRSLREGLAGTNGHPCCVLGSCLQGSGLWGALEGRCSSAAHRDVCGLRFGM